MMRITVLSIILLCGVSSLKANKPDIPFTSYVTYNKHMTAVRMHILHGNYQIAMQKMDSIGHTYPFVFAKDCIRGLQLAVVNQDSMRCRIWLKRSLLRGVPLYILRSNSLTSQTLQMPNCTSTVQSVERLQEIYELSIDGVLAGYIEELYARDQDLTWYVNEGKIPWRYTTHNFRWKRNNKRQFKILRDIIANRGFPGEMLIGLPRFYMDSALAYSSIKNYGPAIGDHRAYIMLIHYYSNHRKDINELLLPEVYMGRMPVYQFASINDFMAEHGKWKYHSNYYNEWHSTKKERFQEGMELRRETLGMESYAEHKQINEAYREVVKRKIANEVVMFW